MVNLRSHHTVSGWTLAKRIKIQHDQCHRNIKVNKPTPPGEPELSDILHLSFHLQLAAVPPELKGRCSVAEASQISGYAKHDQ